MRDVVLFSAAIPFQGGHHHVNERFRGLRDASFSALRGYVATDFDPPAHLGAERCPPLAAAERSASMRANRSRATAARSARSRRHRPARARASGHVHRAPDDAPEGASAAHECARRGEDAFGRAAAGRAAQHPHAGLTGAAMQDVVALYEEHLARRGFVADPAQRRAVERLQRLYEEWSEYKKRRSNALKRLLVHPDAAEGRLPLGAGRARQELPDGRLLPVRAAGAQAPRALPPFHARDPSRAGRAEGHRGPDRRGGRENRASATA